MSGFRLSALFLILVLFGCQDSAPARPTLVPPPPPTRAAGSLPTPAAPDRENPTPGQLKPRATATPGLAGSINPTNPVEWPAPIAAEDSLARTAPSVVEQDTFNRLAEAHFKENDPIALAIAIAGKPSIDPEIVDPVYPVEGDVRLFWIHNVDTNGWSQIEARLERVTEHAYFWFDTRGLPIDPAALDRAAVAFESFYEVARAVYGEEPSPGIDGDPRIYVLHASAVALCDVTESNASLCGLLGYFSTTDTKPVEIDKHSNEHEMFVLNIDQPVGTSRYISTLVHEYRHMIEHNYDRHDDDWVVEGTATMAQLLVGDERNPQARADAYVEDTDIQMNAWTQGNPGPHYGKGYVFSRYILDRLGPDFYSAWVQHPDRALFAIDAVLDEFGHAFSALDLWVDFTAAVALIGEAEAPDPFRFSESFSANSPATTAVTQFPATLADTVSQFGFDIYTVRGEMPVQVQFTGTTRVSVLEEVLPSSGEAMWWSGRANQSDMSLTRAVDLRGVETATLQYDVFYSIEQGYDFAYALVSTDGGVTWDSLVAEQMDGTDPRDNPGDFALTARFYTGQTRSWISERVDLTPYTGQQIQLRFQYITDAIYTDPGLALDNISIPEIGFFDDVEAGENGWEAAGFLRVTAYIPQVFHLTMVAYEPESGLRVERIPLQEDNTATFMLPLSETHDEGILIVTATNPLIMTPAHYLLSISP